MAHDTFVDADEVLRTFRPVMRAVAAAGGPSCEVVLHNVESPAQARTKLMELPHSSTLDGLIGNRIVLAFSSVRNSAYGSTSASSKG